MPELKTQMETMIRSRRLAVALFCLLTALGLVGNYFRFPLFFSIDFLFGSIFSMLVLQLLGNRAGILSAFISISISYYFWNHPYAIIIVTCEAMVVGWLYSRKRTDLVFADAIYWCLLGIPLVFLFYHEVMHLPLNNATITALKQAVNGVANALIARTIFMAWGYQTRRIEVSMRELIFNCLFIFVLFPSLFLLATQSRNQHEALDTQIRETLTSTAKRSSINLTSWMKRRTEGVVYLAKMASTHPASEMQNAIEQMKQVDSNFLRVGLISERAISVAFSPLQDELGKSNLGRDFSDRPFIPELRSGRHPFLSEVYLGRIGKPKPIISVLAPVVLDERYNGYIAGVINLGMLEALLSEIAPKGNLFKLDYSLVDKNGRIIVSSKLNTKAMDTFARAPGELTRMPDGLIQWLPEKKRNVSVSERWKEAVYISETRVGNLGEWRLILEAPVGPYQKTMFQQYSKHLLALGVILLLAMAMARLLSQLVMSSFDRVRIVTQDLPSRLADKGPVSWSRSMVQEAQQLLDNFQQMAQSLSRQFNKVNDLNASLEARVSERTKELQKSEERWKFALEGAGDGVWDWDMSTGSVTFSKRWYEIQGFAEGEIGPGVEAWEQLVHPDDLPLVNLALQAHFKGETSSFSCEHRVRCKHGEYKWILGRGMVVSRDAYGTPLRAIGTHTDITERKLAEARMQLSSSVFSHAREGIMITDAEGTIIEVNDAFSRITGYTRAEAVGQNPRILNSGRQPPEYYSAMWRDLQNRGFWIGEVWNRRKSNEVYAEMQTISSVLDSSGKVQHYVALFTDITPMKEHERQLEHIAHYDALTNLPNRVLLADRLRQAMSQSARRGLSLAVAYLDLDGFKAINDRHGHDIGDALLIAVAQRMKDALREGDTLARIGGDEFIAVLGDLERPQDCEPILARLLQAAFDPILVGETELRVSASIGVTIHPKDGADADQLLRHADQAMYQAKLAGKNRYHMFDVEQDAAVRIQRESLDRIRQALDRHEFVLHYQPKVNMKTGQVIGVEALVRWQHPERGLLAPANFLPIIEDHPLSVELGEWVIDTALTQIGQWQAVGIDMPISINVGAHQLQHSNFVARLSALLDAHPEVPSGRLELEILETSALEDLAQVSAVMAACLRLGVSFALDDFGTGYSSLTYLKHLPAELLKIDQSFVRDMLEDPDDLAIVNGVISLANAFHRQVISEGVETVAHGTQLLSMGCTLAQGYGIARPMPSADLPGWLAQWKPDTAWMS